MGNSSSNTNSVPYATKITTIRHPVFGTLSHSIASSLTTTDTTESAPSSSLSTHQSSQSNNTPDEDMNDSYYYYQQQDGLYCSEAFSIENYLDRASRISDDLGTASSFELVKPSYLTEESSQSASMPLMSIELYRPNSVFGFSENQPLSSCTSSTSTLSTSSTSTSPDYEQVCYSPPVYHKSNYSANQRHRHEASKLPDSRKKELKSGLRVAVMPVRSKSFHQILRPTHNGHILAHNGTIRGASKIKKSTTPPPVSLVKSTNNRSNNFSRQVRQQNPLLFNKKVSEKYRKRERECVIDKMEEFCT